MIEASLDFETRSDIDIKKRGAYVYAESPHFMPLMLWFEIGGVYTLWTHHDRVCPPALRAHIESGGFVRAYNAAFERLVLNWLAEHWAWPKPRLEQYRCTAVQGAAMGLPRRLDKIGEALDIAMKKDRWGSALIKLFCVPKGYGPLGNPLWNDEISHPNEWREFIDYCRRDVESEREVASRLAPLSDYEWRVYALNERINDRGLRIDTASARAALKLIEKAKTTINVELAEVTGAVVTAVTQVAKLKAWLGVQGVDVGSLDKDSIDDLSHNDDLPEDVRIAIRLRAEGAKPSTDKITAMLNRVSSDQRARGVYLHHGAGQTGRFSSRGVQAHNMPRYRKCFEDAHIDVNDMFDAIRTEDPRTLKLLYGEELGRPLHLLSDAVRSFIWAAPGKQFIVADYSSIEGRIAAWIAGEHWKVEAYRALDRGEGHGIYELAAAGIYGIPVALVDKPKRQVGKTAELALGYQGGVGAINRFARPNQIKLAPLLQALWDSAEDLIRSRAEKRFEERVKLHDATAIMLGRDGWIAAELIKVGWRGRHPAIVEAWAALERAAVDAVESPGVVHHAVGASFIVRHDFLWMRLPSGRCLAYGKPRMMQVEAPWADPTLAPELREKKRSLTARSVDPTTETWTRFPLYGGALFNNLVQGSARDILVHGMFNAETAGFEINLQTHDELGAEIETGSRDLAEFLGVTLKMPAWAAGLPMAAAGFVAKRYKKA